MSNISAIAMVAVIALVTATLRFLPFLLLRGRQTPPFIAYLGKVLPFAIMGMLVVYCMKDVDFLSNLYVDLEPYIVTDCSTNILAGLLDRYMDYKLVGAVSPEGENIVVDGHYEFHADEEKLDALIVDMFYAPTN